jgi:hypothetical protein
LRKQRKIVLPTIIHMVRAFRIFFPSIDVEADGNGGIIRYSPEEICDHIEVARELGCPMRVKQNDSGSPCREDPIPFRFSFDRTLG